MGAPLFFLTYILFALLYAGAFAIALGFWRRCRFACTLMLASTSVLLAAISLRAYLHFRMMNGEFNVANADLVFTGVSIVQWVGHALMIAAVFANRSQPPTDSRRRYTPYADDDWDDAPPAEKPGNPGIRTPP